MPTPSLIGLTLPSGRVRVIYCNNNGGFTGPTVGPMLLKHYRDPQKIGQMLDLGDISVLDESLAPPPEVPHSFEHKVKGVTVAYHRDRGDPLKIREMSLEEFRNDPPRMGQEYTYHFHRGQWWAKEYDTWEGLRKLVRRESLNPGA